METVVYLLRHAQYESADHVLPVRLPGFHLSAEGRLEAQKLTEFFSTKNISAIYCSPLERTRETAQIIAQKIHKDVTVDDRLLEIRAPTQGKTEEFGDAMGGWKMYESDWYKKEGGESPEEIFARMDNFIKEKIAQYKGKEILVVSHGDPIMLLVKGYLREMPEYIRMGRYLILSFDPLTSKPSLVR